MRNSLFIICFLAVSVYVGCEDEGGPSNAVDPQLIGEWYYRDTIAVAFPSPSIAFRGMQITADQRFLSLGIETETGTVALAGEDYQILRGDGGFLIVRYNSMVGTLSDTSLYRVERDVLVLTRTYGTRTYYRTHLGALVASPTPSRLSVSIDSTEAQSPSVYPYPPAYLSKASPTTIRLSSPIPVGSIWMEISGFSGPGTYPIGANQGVLTYFSGDVIFSLRTDSSSAGTVTIEQYDEVSNRCSGRFEFVVGSGGLPGPPQMVRNLHDGIFSVPVYR